MSPLMWGDEWSLFGQDAAVMSCLPVLPYVRCSFQGCFLDTVSAASEHLWLIWFNWSALFYIECTLVDERSKLTLNSFFFNVLAKILEPGVKILVEFYIYTSTEWWRHRWDFYFFFCLVTDLMSPSGLFGNPLLCFHNDYFIFPLWF